MPLGFEILHVDFQLPPGVDHRRELLLGRVEIPLAGVAHALEIGERFVRHLETAEPTREVLLHLLRSVRAARIMIDVLVLAEVGLQTQNLALVLLGLLLRAADLGVELLERNFFLGDHVHRAADFRLQVLHHPAGAVDLKFDRHALLHRAGQPVVRRADVAGRVAAEQDHRGQPQTRPP